MHGEPDAARVGGGRDHAVRPVGGDEQMVAGNEVDALTGQLQRCVALQQQDPFVLGLIVQRRLRRRATDDALDAQIAAAEELVEDFAGGRAGEVGEEVVDRNAQQRTTGGEKPKNVRERERLMRGQ